MQITCSSLRRWASKIKLKIVLMVIIACVPSAARTADRVLATSPQRMESLLRDNAADDLERTAAMPTSKVSLLRDAMSVVAKATPATQWSNPTAMTELLLAQPELAVLFNSVFAAAPDGRMLVRIEKGRPTVELPNVADRDYFKDAMKSDQAAVSRAHRGRVSRSPQVIVAVPALDAEGRAIGVLGGSLALQSAALFHHVHTSSRSPESRDLVIDRAGTILSHPDEKLYRGVAAFKLPWEGQTFNVGASVGMIRVAGELNTAADLLRAADVLRAADAACYAAKKRGRSQVEVLQPRDLGGLTPA